MRGLKLVLICLAMTAGPLSAAANAQESPPIFGFWRNPKNTVHVEIKPCGPKTCGYVVWASDKAKADAREKGNGDLIGMQILRDFVPAKDGDWKGKVFAPDLGMTFSGTAQFVDASALKAKGCVIGNFLCKTQTWRRIASAAG